MIETLPSGLRLSAGFDPLTGRRNTLEQTIPAGPDAQAEAEKALNRFIGQVDDQRNARTKATVNQLLDRLLTNLKVSEKTAIDYESLARNHTGRRQWHQEITAADIIFDAVERRVTDFYTKAVEQLGSDKAPARFERDVPPEVARFLSSPAEGARRSCW